MTENVDKTTEKQREGGITGKGFKKGKSGNPAGRPKDSISAISRVKKIFRDNPKEFDKFINDYIKDPSNRKHIVEMIDGKPKQSVEAKVDAEIRIPGVFLPKVKKDG